jgi:DNA-binding response OmpR family regulator
MSKNEPSLKILLAEDDHMMAQCVSDCLEYDRGHEVVWVKYALAATKRLDTETFDLVITDFNLLGTDTGEVIARKALSMNIPVRIYSGASWYEYRLAGLESIWLSKSCLEDVWAFVDEIQAQKKS